MPFLCPAAESDPNSHYLAYMRVQDRVTGEVIRPQEWFARERSRITQLEEERNCKDFEELLQVIENFSRLQHTTLLHPETFQPQPRQVDSNLLVDAFRQIIHKGHLEPSGCLVEELESISEARAQGGGVISDPLSAQQRLFNALFGRFHVSDELYPSWRIVCHWARQLLQGYNWNSWIEFGLEAYSRAKQQAGSLSQDWDDLSTRLQRTHLT